MYVNKTRKYRNTIRWSEKGDTVIIENRKDLPNVLSNYSNSNSFSSFIRQLNNYGFKKVKTNGHSCEYINSKFKRGKASTINKITRQTEMVSKQIKRKKILKRKAVCVEDEVKLKQAEVKELEESIKCLTKENKRIKDSLNEFKSILYERMAHTCEVAFLVFIHFDDTVLNKIENFFIKAGIVCATDCFSNDMSFEEVKKNFENLNQQLVIKSNLSMLHPLDKPNMLLGFFRTLYRDNRTPEQTILINEVREFVQKYIFDHDCVNFNFNMFFEGNQTNQKINESYQTKIDKKIADCSLDNCKFSDIRISDNESLNNLSTCSFSERYFG